LDSLREHLQTRYPQFYDEFQRCSLLRESEYDYPDTKSRNTLLRAHVQMTRLREMDMILQNAQRQGRISFYMTCRGEEAIHIGSASALERKDVVLAQYREAGLLMWRGFTLQQFTNQCFSNDLDLGRGRQMPVHYGSRALNYHTISSPLGTQLPQAVGVAYHLKLQQQNQVAVCFFGDGCASTTDFHSACNFAATLKVPLLFICRNNGYAISTPVTEQYAGDGIVSRAPGYGMAGIRVDGNDIFAVHEAVRAAKEYALSKSAPVMLEMMTYRQGHHSTSDDSTRYRNLEEVHAFQHHGDPCKRMDAFLKNQQLVDESWLVTTRDEEKLAVLKAMEAAEQRPDPPLDSLFEDVYEEVPLHLQRQEEQLRQHMKTYPKRYS
jgi:2-oxoisovalerate dehydrogenase E1 component alpha subunit